MASHPPARCCTIGVQHEGQAKGSIIEQNGISTYVAKPAKTADYAILLLTDVIGHENFNTQLIADQLAANGYLTIVPDLFRGDALKLEDAAKPGFSFPAWKASHTIDTTDPIVEKTISYIQHELGVKKIGACGYCWGAKWLCRYMTAGKGIEVGFVAHPSFVEEEELRAITGPLSIAAAETDTIFTAERRHRSEEILKEIKATYQLTLYSGVAHGFSVRGDVKDSVVKFAKEAAFLQAVQWFDGFLKGDRSTAAF